MVRGQESRIARGGNLSSSLSQGEGAAGLGPTNQQRERARVKARVRAREILREYFVPVWYHGDYDRINGAEGENQGLKLKEESARAGLAGALVPGQRPAQPINASPAASRRIGPC
jgi:hypothetical protein